jgi:hypothetical protein
MIYRIIIDFINKWATSSDTLIQCKYEELGSFVITNNTELGFSFLFLKIIPSNITET